MFKRRRKIETTAEKSGESKGTEKVPFFKRVASGLLDAFFPENIKCICCGDELSKETDYCLCGSCNKTLSFATESICLKCGVQLENLSDFCQTCKFTAREFTIARAPLIYEGTAAKLVKDFKSGDKFLAPYLAAIMADCYEKELAAYQIDAAVYVPSDKERIKARGYNQSEELCKHFCEKTAVPFIKDCLVEIRTTKKQALLPAAERAENVAGAYALNPNFDKSQLKHKNILLIDDIFTTGSTAGECARILKKGGAKDVFVLTLATGKGK